jgi:CheY-like chemotaxis protein
MKILLADDDEISRKIIASFLARFGYESLVVQNGAEAWEILQTPAAPPLAICDWMMPRMTGPEVCARLRAIQQPVRTYVILLSSRNSKLDIVKGLDAGADDYIVKPCDLTELQARLRVALRALNYEAQLRKTIAEYDALIRRHTMLGEMAGQQVAAQAAPPPAGPMVAAPPTATVAPAAAPDLGAMLCEAVREIGLGQAQLDSNPAPAGAADFSVLLPAYVKRDAAWVDARLDITRGGAHALCRAVLRRSANSEHELLGVLAEAVHLLLGARGLAPAKQALGLVPVLPPVAARSDALLRSAGPGRRFALKLPELVIHATLHATPAVVKQKSAAQLQPGDLVVDNARAAGQAEQAVLSAGELLTAHRLGALAELPPATLAGLTVAVVEAPETSRAHLRPGA